MQHCYFTPTRKVNKQHKAAVWGLQPLRSLDFGQTRKGLSNVMNLSRHTHTGLNTPAFCSPLVTFFPKGWPEVIQMQSHDLKCLTASSLLRSGLTGRRRDFNGSSPENNLTPSAGVLNWILTLSFPSAPCLTLRSTLTSSPLLNPLHLIRPALNTA